MKTKPRGKTFKKLILLIIAFIRLTHAEGGMWKQEEQSSDFASRLNESQIGPDPQSGRGTQLRSLNTLNCCLGEAFIAPLIYQCVSTKDGSLLVLAA